MTAPLFTVSVDFMGVLEEVFPITRIHVSSPVIVPPFRVQAAPFCVNIAVPLPDAVSVPPCLQIIFPVPTVSFIVKEPVESVIVIALAAKAADIVFPFKSRVMFF